MSFAKDDNLVFSFPVVIPLISISCLTACPSTSEAIIIVLIVRLCPVPGINGEILEFHYYLYNASQISLVLEVAMFCWL